MARQEATILLTGPVGNLSFYKTQDGYFVRRKSGVSRNRIMNDAAFVRARENIAEFRRAALAAKLLRRAIRPWSDNRVFSRLTGAMVRVIQSDAFNARGERRMNDGNSKLLTDFDFNRYCQLKEIFPLRFIPSINRLTGEMRIDVPQFTPGEICNTGVATHLSLKAIGAVIDFESNSFQTVSSETVVIPIAVGSHEPLTFSLAVAPGSTSPMFLVLGVEYLQAVNNKLYALKDCGLNAMGIVAAHSGQQLPTIDRRSVEQARRQEAPVHPPLFRDTRRRSAPALLRRHHLLADDYRTFATYRLSPRALQNTGKESALLLERPP